MESICLQYIVMWVLLLSNGASSLKCYQCISLSCPEAKSFCDQVKSYVVEKLPELYFYTSKIPWCPDPIGSEDSWETLESMSSTPCGEENAGEATCVLGRFEVTTAVSGMGNVTSYGTSLGCARRKLLEYTRAATLRRECSIVSSQSAKKNSLTHFFEIEHCSIISDMCMEEDFCINPKSSVVKPFRDGDSGSSVSPLFIIFIVILIIGVLALVLTMLGIKYDS